MDLPFSDLSLLPCAGATALPLLVLCAASPAQSQPDAGVKSLVAKIDAARGKATPPATLAVEGTFTVTVEGGGDEPIAKGKFREKFAGAAKARTTSDLGQHGLMENGVDGDLVWALDPTMGAKVYRGTHASAARRYCALLRGARPSDLYAEFARIGTQVLDGKEHVVVRMTPAEGKADTWYVDPETWRVSRIDIALPTPESADATWDLGDEMDAQVTFGDWKAVDGVLIAQRRRLKMGPMTVTSTCTKIEVGAKLDPATFTPPEAVTRDQSKPMQKAFDAEGKPNYQVVERTVQPVAAIRVKCKPKDISATLAVLFPEIMAHVNATGVRLAGPPYTRYHATSDDEVDLEAGMPVAKPVADKGRVKAGELPAGKAVTAWHLGPYEKLTDAHQKLKAWLDAQRLKPRGGPWEVYWTDPGMVPNPEKWRTQLFAPIE